MSSVVRIGARTPSHGLSGGFDDSAFGAHHIRVGRDGHLAFLWRSGVCCRSGRRSILGIPAYSTNKAGTIQDGAFATLIKQAIKIIQLETNSMSNKPRNQRLAHMKLYVEICAEKEWPCIKSIFKVQGNKLQCFPFGHYFDHRLGSHGCRWFHSGATKTRAAAACQYAISAWHADIIINLGTCGGVAQNVKERDIILANRTIQYDVIERFGAPTESFQKYQETIIDVSWAEKCGSSEISHVGAIASADQDLSVECRSKLRKAKILAADWE